MRKRVWLPSLIACGLLALSGQSMASIQMDRVSVEGTVSEIQEKALVIQTPAGPVRAPRPTMSGESVVRKGESIRVELSLEELLRLNQLDGGERPKTP